MRKLIVLLLILWAQGLAAQYLPIHPGYPVYPFLMELANEGLLDISTAALPYSERQIQSWLSEVDRSQLNDRQRKELDYYLQLERRLPLRYQKDSLFSFGIGPILGGNYYRNENGSAYHWWNGAEATAAIGKWVFYGSLRDNHESEFLTQPDFMNQNYGGANFKNVGDGKIDFWESRGGVSYDFGMGSIGLYKDHFEWGSNYNGANILSGRTQSFAHIAFNIQPTSWFEFRYIHGWLVSEVIDSTKTFTVTNGYGSSSRQVYHRKYIAANFFTFKPFRWAHISLGNSIIYDYDTPHPVYLIPVMFYKAVDHHLNSGIGNMNSQLFLDLSLRPFRGGQVYTTLFMDEVAVGRLSEPEEHNFVSSKSGVRLDNLLPNLYLGLEYTWSNALAFRHNVTTTTYESNRFNLGHYLEDNAKELYLYAGFRPIRAMDIRLSYQTADKGPDHTLLGTLPRTTIDPINPVVWESDIFSIQFSWNLLHNASLRFGYSFSDVQGEEGYLETWTPAFRQGKLNEFNMGLNWGF